MSLPKLFDRVKETSTSTGTGDITLAGAVSKFRAFGDVLSNNDIAFYVIEHQSANEWEVGYCPWLTGNTLDRSAATILASSNAGSAVDFSAGTKHVWLDSPANLLDRIMQVEEITGTSATMVPNRTYIANNASLVTLTLPDTASVGTRIKVIGKGAGGWKIAQNASELIRYRGVTTTTGTSGYLQSINDEDVVELVCVVADTEWLVVSMSDRVQTDTGSIWGSRCILDKFTASGTWTKPLGAVKVDIQGVGAGGGGGSGRRGAAGSARGGGGGGAAGGLVVHSVDASLLNATETVTIGSGGSGGGAISADNTNGSSGSVGGATSFGPVSFRTGANGVGGTTTGGGGGGGSLHYIVVSIGGGANASAGTTGTTPSTPSANAIHPGPGCGGAGLSSGNSEVSGNAGAAVLGYLASETLAAGGIAGVVNAARDGGDGNPGFSARMFHGGSGGGGGASESDGVTAAGNGGDGGVGGGGGGGGGASANGANSGAGGNGGRAEIWVFSYL